MKWTHKNNATGEVVFITLESEMGPHPSDIGGVISWKTFYRNYTELSSKEQYELNHRRYKSWIHR